MSDRAAVRALAFATSLAVAGCAAVAPDPHPRVALDTTAGRIVVELDPGRAPISTENFLRYVADAHYDGTIFHRVVEGFMIQGGGLDATLAERPTRAAIANEAKNGLSNRAGTIAMARKGEPDSATAQFYINVVDNVRLDHVDVPRERVYGYAVFGRVIDGMDVVERIRHVPVHTVGAYENVPVHPVVITKATRLPRVGRP